jgi:hypothetical protein
MKKRFVIWTLVLAAFAGLSVFLWRWHHAPVRLGVITDKDIAEAVASLNGGNELPTPAAVIPIGMNRPMRLAVGNLGGSDDEQNRKLEDLVVADLTGAPGLEMVERQSLDKVLQELNLGISHLVRAQDAVQVGKLLKADWFLLGTRANINGTNTLVVRLVDSRTGIMRDAGVFTGNSSPVKLAADIAGFVRLSRQDAAIAKPRVYLAIGTFQDFSLNNRQAAFPAQLRTYLMAAYQGTNVTLLEREAVDVLYREVRLDLKGLTEGGNGPPPQPPAAAYWLVDGDYQSYETTNSQVEVALRIHRMFGRVSKQTLRSPSDGRLFEQIKSAIDTRIKQDSSAILLSLATEASEQMLAGKELVGLKVFDNAAYWSGNHKVTFPVGVGRVYNYSERTDPREFARIHRNLGEAIKAFETVLLLEPANREAKVCLATCYADSVIADLDKARNLYHEVIEEPVQDSWTGAAELGLLSSFYRRNPDEKSRWFAAAALQNTNSALDAFYQQNATNDAAIDVSNEDTVEQLEAQQMQRIRSYKEYLDGRTGPNDFQGFFSTGNFGLDQLFTAFSDDNSRDKELAKLLPKMELEVPELAPHLSSEVLKLVRNTDSPVIAEYKKQLEWCLTHTNQVYHPEQFWRSACSSALDWAFHYHQNELALETLEGYRAKVGPDFGDYYKMELGFAYKGTGRWNEALEIFDSYGKTPVTGFGSGPWGNGRPSVFPSEEADFCREKLGLPVVSDPREFQMEPICACSGFAFDGTGLWIVTGNQLSRLDMNLRTTLTIDLPTSANTPVTTLETGADKLWIGTEGDGLIEFDKTSQQCRHLMVKDGLMMDKICSLHLSENTLWIGYGNKSQIGWGNSSLAGGIGFLNLLSHQFVSFAVPLSAKTTDNNYQAPADQPPFRAVKAIANGTSKDVWFLTAGTFFKAGSPTEETSLRHYQSESNAWSEFPKVSSGSCLAADAEHLYCGQFDFVSAARTGSFGVTVLDLRDGQCRPLNITGPILPNSVSALAIDGKDLWVGGMGYIAVIDPAQDLIKNFAMLHAESVDKIQVGGGYVWAQYNGYLYRAPIGDSQEKFYRTQLARLVPFQCQKDTNGAAILQRLPVRENMVERDGMYYCGFKFTIPPWADGNLKLMYVMAKTEAQKDYGAYMVSQIVSENGPSPGSYGYLRESLTNYPQLHTQFPYAGKLTTQTFDIKRLEPGKTYGIWFGFDKPDLPDIAFAMTINSPRGTNEFGILPMR